MPGWIKEIHWQPTQDIHVHHFFYGVLILAVSGFIALIYKNTSKVILAIIYGLGLFLAFDELNVLFKLRETDQDPYRQLGNLIIASVFFILFLVSKNKNSP